MGGREGGRKSLRDETVQANVINLSWTTIQRALNSAKLSLEHKRKIAIEVVKKTCPQKMELDSNIKGTSIFIVQDTQGESKYKNRLETVEQDQQA